MEKAKYLKMIQIVEENRKAILLKRAKIKEMKLNREANLESKKNKEKKKDKNKKKKVVSIVPSEGGYEPDVESGSDNETLPEIRVNPEDIVVNYTDLYPAEMIIWRDFQPKDIEANFTIELTYADKPKDYLYLKAVCRVVSPSFVHNLDRQHLDFGPTAIGDSKRRILELKNVQGTYPILILTGQGIIKFSFYRCGDHTEDHFFKSGWDV